jgi:hypothetical protein
MTYKINDKPVTLKQFAHENILQILNTLENFEAMNNEDLLEVAGAFSEITEYVDSINEQIKEAKDWYKKEQELEAEHIRIERAMVRR